jgi:hypothetical protein
MLLIPYLTPFKCLIPITLTGTVRLFSDLLSGIPVTVSPFDGLRIAGTFSKVFPKMFLKVPKIFQSLFFKGFRHFGL